MHRIDADGYIVEDGNRVFIDQDLPNEPGTILDAGFANAIQEEISSVIEGAGLSLRSDSGADKTAGWDQLWRAITQNQIIGTDALGFQSVTQNKLATGSVGTTELQTSAVTTSKIAPGAVNTAELANGAVTEPKLANDAVTEDKLAEGSVTNFNIKNRRVYISGMTLTTDNGSYAGAAELKIVIAQPYISFHFRVTDSVVLPSSGAGNTLYFQGDTGLPTEIQSEYEYYLAEHTLGTGVTTANNTVPTPCPFVISTSIGTPNRNPVVQITSMLGEFSDETFMKSLHGTVML